MQKIIIKRRQPKGNIISRGEFIALSLIVAAFTFAFTVLYAGAANV